ncbi:GGDEF domain-containing protein [Acidiphilium acidophilum]|jgi:diguanylate cyclase (GGDEF) domain|uniref:diguanylate cyclase n=1 Tax=Acidiphilium acidophilum TaxID=76588 RepID=A0AAW9DTZ5_ACIAO|nr:GGDEF domain-containing protein [Acidiphilium acidophilum]MDX5932014.1 GGDEF domain-containing protein [Acidiphilium acidophilum]GBQ25413.1 hypothetical protein AA700_1548 [Acidiphilium acidophilum DSM 700]
MNRNDLYDRKSAVRGGLQVAEAMKRSMILRQWVAGNLIRLMMNVLTSMDERNHPIEVRESLINALFGRIANVLLVGVAGFGCGVFSFERSGAILPLWCGGLGFGFVVARATLIRQFQRQLVKPDGRGLDRLTVGFGILAIASSLCWGILCFDCLALSGDPVLYTMVLVTTVASAGGVAARNAGAPRIAKLQLLTSLVPIMAGALFANDDAYSFLLLLIPALLYGLFELIAEINQQLVQSFRSELKLSRMSNIDHLTEIPNRRQFASQSAAALATCRDLRQPLSVMMIDVDFFKAFNDNYGHQAGDRCLQQVARVLRDNLRHEGDLVSRYGGEEFAVSLQNATETEAESVAARLCGAIAAAAIAHRHRDDAIDIVTVSIGVVASDRSFEGIDQLVNAADKALYAAKRSGRNKVVVARHAYPPDLAVV